jgi:hypothetical protein
MLLEHLTRAAADRTFCTAGSNKPMRIAMMAITTSNSMRVNAGREYFGCMVRLRYDGTTVRLV